MLKRWLMLACLLVSTAGPAAAQDAVFFGRVIGSDQAEGPPADWVATLTVIRKSDNEKIQQCDSQGDLFACMGPREQDVRILIQAMGYESRVTDVRANTPLLRLRPDLVLEQITQAYAMQTYS